MVSSRGKVKTEEIKANLVVVGGGGAGLAAAVAATETGARDIIVLEARHASGGNSALAMGLFSVGSQGQKREELITSFDEYFKQSMSYNHWRTNPRLTRILIEKSGDVIQWLEKQGVKFEPAPSPNPDQHTPITRIAGPGRGGTHVMRALAKKCEDLGVRILCQTRAKRLLTDSDGRITGVLAEANGKEVSVTTKSAVIATGGLAGNKELLKKYLPTYHEEDEVYLGGLPNQGDGLLMATEIGAATDGYITPEISGFKVPWSGHLCIIVNKPNTIQVNKRGERFTDESVDHPEAANPLYRQPGKIAYALFDEKIKGSIFQEKLTIRDEGMIPSGTWPAQAEKDLQLQAEKGRVKISDSWDEIADWMGAAPEVLKETIDEYNTACDRGRDDIFAKDQRHLLPLRMPPYYAIKFCVNLLVTHGDIKISHHMEVLNKQDNPIPGLYAAGDDTGDIDTDTYNMHIGGHSFGFALNSGRIAGENAARFIARQ